MNRASLVAMTFTAILAIEAGVVLTLAWTGAINPAATQEHLPGVHWWMETLRVNAVKDRAEEKPPGSLQDPATLATGLEHFHEMCVQCHGGPGIKGAEWAGGLNPQPPDLAKVDLTAPEMFWIVKHGLRMTGMPAWGPSHSDEELWAIVGFVQTLPGMSADEYARKVQQAGLQFQTERHGHAGQGHSGSGHHDEGGAGVGEGASKEATPPPQGQPTGDGHDHAGHAH